MRVRVSLLATELSVSEEIELEESIRALRLMHDRVATDDPLAAPPIVSGGSMGTPSLKKDRAGASVATLTSRVPSIGRVRCGCRGPGPWALDACFRYGPVRWTLSLSSALSGVPGAALQTGSVGFTGRTRTACCSACRSRSCCIPIPSRACRQRLPLRRGRIPRWGSAIAQRLLRR